MSDGFNDFRLSLSGATINVPINRSEFLIFAEDISWQHMTSFYVDGQVYVRLENEAQDIVGQWDAIVARSFRNLAINGESSVITMERLIFLDLIREVITYELIGFDE
jgi:hypothetical protein